MEKERTSIRLLGEEDIETAIDVIWEVFASFVAPDYTEEGIAEFGSILEYDFLLSKLGEGEIRMWGAFDQEQLVGVCATRHLTHVSLLFVKEPYQGEKVATRLLKRALFDARMVDESVSRVTVHSSEFAVGFFRKMGFVELEPLQHEDGMTFVPMALEAKEEFNA